MGRILITLGIAVLSVNYIACTQTVTDEPGSGGHTAPGTGLVFEDATNRIIAVVYGNDVGTAVEGDKFQELLDRIDKLEQANNGAGAFLGTQPNPGDALFTFGGQVGMPAVNAACAALFNTATNAHWCTQQEIITNYHNGTLLSGQGWVYNTSGGDPFVRPASTGAPGLIGGFGNLTSSCRGMAYNSGDLARGTTYHIQNLNSKATADTAGSLTGTPSLTVYFQERSCQDPGFGLPCCGTPGS